MLAYAFLPQRAIPIKWFLGGRQVWWRPIRNVKKALVTAIVIGSLAPTFSFFFFFLLSLFCFYVFMGLFPFFNCGFTVESEPPLAAAVRQGRRRRLLVCLGPSRNYTFSSSWRVMRMQRGPVGWPGGCALGRPDAPGGCRCDKGK